MKIFLLLFFFTATNIQAAESRYDVEGRCDQFRNIQINDEENLKLKAECLCKPPGEDFILERLKTNLGMTDAEKLLKEVVTEPANYPLREQMKSHYRKLQNATVLAKRKIEAEMKADFEQMIDGAGVRQGVPDFPTAGATATFSGAPGSMVLTMKELKKIDGDFLNEDIAKKIDPVVSIHYYYPIDRYEYVLSYEGKLLPAEDAARLLQTEFQTACYNRFWENVGIRKMNKQLRDTGKTKGQ